MNPVQYGAACQALVDTFDALECGQKDHKYWGDDAVATVRAEIKVHYIAEQNRRCCYCGREYPTDNNAVWDGEHIIAKKIAPHFMFEPRNLAASCKDCNIAKGDDEVRTNPKRKSFPDEAKHYKIVHPHFDNYHDHIRWYGDVVKPLSPKGAELVGMCKLWRFGITKAGAEVTPPNPLVDGLIGVMMDPQADALTKEVAIEAYKTYVRAQPQKAAD
ncbi:HNH endonuclease [Pelagovum pacificum]|uniref:HNH endonuclease n=1 Tax=Pelagovum pacificum TaxID=2588711 RepID=A0A5C5G7Z6_9RHOB|nr:hypothetical protein [Pelagovum pacificum]QQA41525.1 hypothetical protein I8N54_11880 [Pelagovum pacificum]TNY30806.1 hypothetical protein FHY64_16960 [Pelagovum pacificum]